MREVHYILKNGIAMPTYDRNEWLKQFGNADLRRVALTEIHHHTVSTVFLGIDHGLGRSEFPVLFETMVFKGEHSLKTVDDGQSVAFQDEATQEWRDMQRYSFYGDAIQGHHETVRAIEKQFGELQERVSGLLYGIINAEEWVRDQ